MELVLYIAFIHLVACLSPGPDIFLVVLNSLRHGWKTGVATTSGILTGVCLHITLGITGISYLITRGETVRNSVALAGGAFLAYLGFRGLLAWSQKPGVQSQRNKVEPSCLNQRSAWLQGFLVNLLNPKAFLFFIGLFSVMLGPEVELPVKIACVVVIIGVQAVAFSTVAFLVDRPAFRNKWTQLQVWLDHGISLILLALGLWIWIDILF